ncbi:hypothetical protein [Ponticoccus litoralis]|uniref:Uncharacterized protein n=1 Tax=Ponticoccus litoralis TaxID=422297 RepID=A0AAW9SPM7_9RHOB
MSELEEFHQSLIADIQGNADAMGAYVQEAFFEKVGEILNEAGEIEEADYCHFAGKRGGSRCRSADTAAIHVTPTVSLH